MYLIVYSIFEPFLLVKYCQIFLGKKYVEKQHALGFEDPC